MYIVKRTTKCKPTVEENHERGGSARTDPLIGFERERVWVSGLQQITSQDDLGIVVEKKESTFIPLEAPFNFLVWQVPHMSVAPVK